MSTSRRRLGRRSRTQTRRAVESRRNLKRRPLFAEQLECRALMAVDANPWHNALFASDVNNDFHLAPDDILPIINALNSVGPGPIAEVMQKLNGSAEAEAGSNVLKLDVDGDGFLSPSDALIPINILNAEAEGSDMYIRLDVTTLTGQTIAGSPRPQVNVGDQFLVKAFVKDTRTPSATVAPDGVFAAYLDVLFDSSLVSVDTRENQQIEVVGDPNSNGTFTLTFNGETTAPLTYIKADDNGGITSPTPVQIQNALVALNSINPGDVEVSRKDVTASAWTVKFGGKLANQNVPNLTASGSFTGGSNPTVSVTELANTKLSPFTFSTQYPNGLSGQISTQVDGLIDELGAFSGLSPLGSNERLLVTFEVTAKSGGTVTFVSDPADADTNKILLYNTILGGNARITPTNPDYRSVSVDIIQLVNANDDTANVLENSTNNEITVLVNDTVNSGSKRIVSVTTPTSGTATIFDKGTTTTTDDVIRYTPAAGFSGVATFSYTAGDGLGNTDTAVVTVNVGSVNDAPSITNVPSAQTVSEDGTLVFSKATNTVPTFSDPDSATSPVILTLNVTNGTLTLNPTTGLNSVSNNGTSSVTVTASISEINTALNSISLQYQPNQNFVGNDNLIISVNDQGATGSGGPKSDTKTVAIAITAVNDAPVNTVPVGQSILEDETLTLSGATQISIADIDAGTGSVQVTVSATNGVWSVPNAANATVTGQGTGSIVFSGTVTAVNSALAGIIYDPNLNFVGTETISVVTNDNGNTGTGGAKSDSDSFTVDVQPSVRPRARQDAFSVTEDSTSSTSANTFTILSNDVLNVGAQAILVSFTQASNGSVTRVNNNLVYVPNADFFGTDSFSYTINDTSGLGVDSTATVNVTVREVNDAPTATNDTRSTAEDTALSMTSADLTSNDSKGTNEGSQTLTITNVIATSAGGTVSVSNGTVTYAPTQDFVGAFTFTYSATDNGTSLGVSDPKTTVGTVTVNVTAVNDVPVAGADSKATAEDTTLQFNASTLLANDSPGGGTDESTQGLSVVSVTAVSGGSASLSNGVITFVPTTDFFGTATVNYVVQDDGTTNGAADAKSTTGVISINVTSVNDVPTAGADSKTAIKNLASTYTIASLLSNDSSGPANESSQALSISAVSSTSTRGGTVVLNGNGTITYTPPANITGADSFTYTLADNGQTNGVSDPKTASGTVNVDIKDFVPSNVSGAVFVDLDNDGVRDSNERGMANVVINLKGVDFQNVVIDVSTRTARDGSFSFTNLAPGEYVVSEVQPTNSVDGKEHAGNGLTVIANRNDALALSIPLAGGIDSTGNNFAERGLNSAFAAINSSLFASDLNGSNSMSTENGLIFSFQDTTLSQLNWWLALNGWEGVSPVSLVFANDRQSAVLTVLNTQGQQMKTTVTVASARLRVRQDATGNTVAQIVGRPADFTFQLVSSGSAGEGEYSDDEIPVSPAQKNAYVAAVEAIFAKGDWA